MAEPDCGAVSCVGFYDAVYCSHSCECDTEICTQKETNKQNSVWLILPARHLDLCSNAQEVDECHTHIHINCDRFRKILASHRYFTTQVRMSRPVTGTMEGWSTLKM